MFIGSSPNRCNNGDSSEKEHFFFLRHCDSRMSLLRILSSRERIITSRSPSVENNAPSGICDQFAIQFDNKATWTHSGLGFDMVVQYLLRMEAPICPVLLDILSL